MALPLDVPMNADGAVLPMSPGIGGMPPRQPLDMPTQELRGVARTVRDHATPQVRLARLITFGGAALLTGIGLYEMIQVVLVGEMTVLEGVLAGFFAVTFGWISLAATSAIAGLAVPPARHSRNPGGALATLTALLVPVYHEDPQADRRRDRSDGEGPAAPRADERLRGRHPVRFHRRRRLGKRDPGVRAPCGAAPRRDSGLVPAALGEHRQEGGQHQGFRRELGRPLRPHAGARRGQPDVGRNTRRAGGLDGGRSRPRPPPDGAGARRRQQPLRPPAAIRRARHGPVVAHGPRRLAGQRRQFLGPQRHRPHRRLRAVLRTAQPARPQAVRRPDPLA